MIRNLSLLLILNFISCSTNKTQLNYELIGIYEYEEADKTENHRIFIDTVQNKLNGFYFGTESTGEHGISFYGNPLENLFYGKDSINFEIGTRELYKSTLNKVYKPNQKPKKKTRTGISKSRLKYNGQITKNGLILTCKSEFGHCWIDKMEFKKISELR